MSSVRGESKGWDEAAQNGAIPWIEGGNGSCSSGRIMEPETITFRGVAEPPEAPRPVVIETSGVEIVDHPFAVAPANMNGSAAPAAECAEKRERVVHFASTLRRIA